MPNLRNGQWCKFAVTDKSVVVDLVSGRTATLDGVDAALIAESCHKSVDGRCVGIYLGSGRDPVTLRDTSAHIVCVRSNGENVRFLRDGQAALASLADVSDLEGIDYRAPEGRADIPASRLTMEV